MKKRYAGSIGGYHRSFDKSPCCSGKTTRELQRSKDIDDTASYSIYTCRECGFQYTTEEIWWAEQKGRRRVFWNWRLHDIEQLP